MLPCALLRDRSIASGARLVRAPGLALLLASALALPACGGGGDAGSALGPQEGANHPMVGRKAPDFAAEDPSGLWLPLSNLKGKPVALLFFRPGAAFAPELVAELGRFRADPDNVPTVFLGLARDSMDRIKEFQRIQKASLPLLRDSGPIGASYGVGDLATIVLLDADGIVRFRLDGFLGAQLRPRLEATREMLRRLPQIVKEGAQALDLAYTKDPRAPVFASRDLDGRAVDLAALRGKVVVLNFFDQECPHCQRDLPRLVPVLRSSAPGAWRPAV